MRKSLTDILHTGDRERLTSAWNSTKAAEDFAPLPAGSYVARITSGELFTAKAKGTAGYKLAFVVVEGEFSGRRFWHDTWLTPAALAMAKRDLTKLGITSLEQLEKPLPDGIVCRTKLSLRTNDDGTKSNHVKSIDVLRVEVTQPDPFDTGVDGAPEGGES